MIAPDISPRFSADSRHRPRGPPQRTHYPASRSTARNPRRHPKCNPPTFTNVSNAC